MDNTGGKEATEQHVLRITEVMQDHLWLVFYQKCRLMHILPSKYVISQPIT